MVCIYYKYTKGIKKSQGEQPSLFQGPEYFGIQFLEFILLDQIPDALDRTFNRGNDVPGQKFRNIMKKARKKIVHPPGLAPFHHQGEKIPVAGNNEHVPQNSRFRDTRSLGPALLETELTA